MSDSLGPHGLEPTGLLRPWDFPGKNTEVGCNFLLQGNFPTQGSNLGLLHCRQMLYHCTRGGIKTIPKKKKCKKAKELSEEVLQITVKRREAKGKREKERYTRLNEEFQRSARRDKKAFLSDQCKEIEENNRKRKTRDIFKQIMQRWAQ